MLGRVKGDLRIKHHALDSSIRADIEACKTDLELAGISMADDRDPLIEKAIKLYCRWQNNYEGEAERYEKAYLNLKIALSLTGDYNGRWSNHV